MEETGKKTLDKVNEKFISELVYLGMSEEKSVEMVSLFVMSWIKSKGEKIDLYQYESDVCIFLEKLKKKV